ncbi:MAG: hypothetical protein L0G99_12540, partial [Propionibacteriales bacterium]|nr:hypothetical protein [Propionibacteriales bacterium]
MRRVTTTVGVLAVVLLVVGGLVSGLFASAGRNVLYASGLLVDGGSPTVDPTLFSSSPTPSPEAASATPVLS